LLGSALDPHHVIKRSAGGALADPNNIIAVCRECHRMTDNEFRRGRLVITPLGDERFSCFILFARDKFAAAPLSPPWRWVRWRSRKRSTVPTVR